MHDVMWQKAVAALQVFCVSPSILQHDATGCLYSHMVICKGDGEATVCERVVCSRSEELYWAD